MPAYNEAGATHGRDPAATVSLFHVDIFQSSLLAFIMHVGCTA